MADKPLQFKDKLSIALLRFFGALPLPFLRAFGAAIGRLAGRLRNMSAYRTIYRNLELCYPDKGEAWWQETTRQSLISTGMTGMEFARTWYMPPEYSIGLIRKVHGEALFHEALAAGKGVIAILPHWGTWEFMNAWVNKYTSAIIMYKPIKQPGVDRLIVESRAVLNATMVPTDESGVRATFKALRKGGFSAILPDHMPGDDNGGVYAPFFGISTRTGVIVPKLAARTGSRVLVLGCIRAGDGFDIHVHAADPDVGHEDPVIGATAMNRSMERMIALDPAQYQWTYKRFKENENLPNPYDRR